MAAAPAIRPNPDPKQTDAPVADVAAPAPVVPADASMADPAGSPARKLQEGLAQRLAQAPESSTRALTVAFLVVCLASWGMVFAVLNQI